MPRKKKDPNEMTDRELLRQVFPERVVKALEHEIEMRNADTNDPDQPPGSPDKTRV